MNTIRQRTPEWHEIRKTGVGSSDAPVIAGVSSWGDTRTLWAEKLDLTAPTIETDRMRWGRLLESAIAEAYTETTGRKVRKVHAVRRHRRHRFMLASLDRVTRTGKRIVEIKTQGFRNDEWGEPGTDEVPDVYRVQVQHQMAVTGYDIADIPVLFGGSAFEVYTVERDERLIDALIKLEAVFWSHVEQRIPPPPNPRIVIERPVRADLLEADEDLRDLIRRGRAARAVVKAAETDSEALDALVKERIGDFSGVVDLASYKRNSPSTKTDWSLVASAFRRGIEASTLDIDAVFPGGLDTIEALFTQTVPGNRPLRYLKEIPDADQD